MSAAETTKRNSFFPELGNGYEFAKLENEVLKFWKDKNVFKETLKKSEKSGKDFFFYDGPPFATGLPHYGHLIGGTLKDVVPRYWTMRGYHVDRRFGWDCHGLPIEFEIEKTLNLNGSLAILDYGVGKFNEACRGTVLKYTKEWRQTVERMGRWVDMDNGYKTMDPEFMESVWWIFKQLFDKGLIYEGKKVVPYSWRLTAPLSNFEASLNYKDVQDPALTVLAPLVSGRAEWQGNTALAIWTTTPWTLPSNLAVAIHSDPEVVSYARYALKDAVGKITHIIMAESRAEIYGLADGEKIRNHDLLHLHYEPFFNVYNGETRKKENAYRVLDGSAFVSSGDGTGLVHMAPAFGEDDFFACQKAGLSIVDPVDAQGNFSKELAADARIAPFVGQFVKEADKGLIKVLKDAGRVLKHETLNHSYPFCDRTDTPLIYKAISSWFVKVESIRDELLKSNSQIHWVPGHIKEGRFGKWLANARDWCISRNRFWGTPLPVWKCSDCSHIEVMGSRAELEKFAGHEVKDLHKHFVDEIVKDCPKCKTSKSLRRTPEVLDCWFESGSMPYAQNHYPFENKEKLDNAFPADFIAEGLDQTRGWFYTLTVLSTALFKRPAFKNCVVNGIILAEDGRKMSKRLKNYPDPNMILEKYGADALRLYLLQSPAIHGDELRLSEKGIGDVLRSVLLPLWNAYGFFAVYANIDGWTPSLLSKAPSIENRSLLDQWILRRSEEAETKIHKLMESYELSNFAGVLTSFLDDLTNWYIRMSRERFWASEEASSTEKNAAYATLFTVLDRLATLMAPALPFFSETLSAMLRGQTAADLLQKASPVDSVHARVFDERSLKGALLSESSQKLIREMELAKRLILMGRSLRAEAKIGLRQPLRAMRVAGLSAEEQKGFATVSALVLGETNLKTLDFVKDSTELVEESIKPNHRVLGKKVGGQMKAIETELKKWTSSDIQKFESTGKVSVLGFELVKEDLQIVRKAKEGHSALASFGLVAELDSKLTPELIAEGLERELLHGLQNLRKEKNFHISDRIQVQVEKGSGVFFEILEKACKSPGSMESELLCSKIEIVASLSNADLIEFEGHKVKVLLKKV